MLKEDIGTMTVILNFEPELESELRARAKAREVSVESFIYDLINGNVGFPASAPENAFKLPARNLGDLGPLHRREIYENGG